MGRFIEEQEIKTKGQHGWGGYRVLPRDFLSCDFMVGLPASQRCALIYLYSSICGQEEMKHTETRIMLVRGEAICTINYLAQRAGCGFSAARDALDKAEKAGLITRRQVPNKRKGGASPITVVTWVDFDVYDPPPEGVAQSPAQTLAQSAAQPPAQQAITAANTLDTTQAKTAARKPRAQPAGGGLPLSSAVGDLDGETSESERSHDTPTRTGYGGSEAEGPGPSGASCGQRSDSHSGSAGHPSSHGPASQDQEWRGDAEADCAYALPPGAWPSLPNDAPPPHQDQQRPAPSPPPPTKPKGSKQGKAELTEDQKALITGSGDEAFEAMTRYLRFGAEGIGNERTDLKSSSTDWRKCYEGQLGTGNPHIEQWNAPMLAGFYWFQVSWDRTNQFDPPRSLTLPSFGRLIGDCKNLLKRMTVQQAHRTVQDVVGHWDLICFLIGDKIGRNIEMNETTLSHSLVMEQVRLIQERGQTWVEEKTAEMQRANERKAAGNQPRYVEYTGE